MELKEYLQRTGIKQKALADMLNISHKTLWTLLRRIPDPHLSLASSIVKITGNMVGYEDLLPLKKDKPKKVKRSKKE